MLARAIAKQGPILKVPATAGESELHAAASEPASANDRMEYIRFMGLV
jgi:hypothetical protein